MHEKIIILDLGSQTTQLIGRRIRELNTYCEIVPFNRFPHGAAGIKGVILSGSPYSVYDTNAFRAELADIRGHYPVLGICYGAQFMAHTSGGKVEPANSREYGRAHLSYINNDDPLLKGLSAGTQVWMSHGDSITSLAQPFRIIASTGSVKAAAYRIEGEQTWGVQFHPEVYHTTDGTQILNNFLDICGCCKDWTPASFIESAVAEIKEQLKDDKVILALSGGVDSSVTAVLLNRAIGKNLTCIFVDHGLLRKNEFEHVLRDYEHLGLNVIGVDARGKFYRELAGVTDPEQKRKIIGKGFIDVFDEEARKLKEIKWLGQGTIYPDVIESLSITGTVIKSHHNVGGLPDKMQLKLIEPLRLLFKDEVRRIGTELGMMPHLIKRHPFPGPGLGIRIISDITPEKVRILQEADDLYISLLREWGIYDEVWQAATILLPIRSVGVMGDERTYENTVVLRAVTSTDAMTADWAQLPYDFLAKVSNEIINKVKGVNRVVYDISSKPPATIEWE
ncbi:MAG: glutamine-hydrolyzing GMP synthase [Tannerellaceae bacterium]|jgi:GMP synthase (glutamine-hydrolysing)|nr:glutamine-hydrolyzing GMP synthase [Tannerellaceae bacterium]